MQAVASVFTVIDMTIMKCRTPSPSLFKWKDSLTEQFKRSSEAMQESKRPELS